MSCSPFDLRDYFFGELPESSRLEVQRHLRTCGTCREELDRLGLTQAALLTLRDEEIPKRIGFVSDKVFEPSGLQRWWGAFWASGARLGFVSAAMLSAALLVHSFTRPAPVTAPQAAQQIDLARLEAEFNRRIEQAVHKAVDESETRQQKKTAALLAAVEHHAELERKAVMLAAEENFEVMRKSLNTMILVSADRGSVR
jgi:hypothetical protein